MRERNKKCQEERNGKKGRGKKRAKNGADPEELKAYNSSLRNLYAVIPLDSKKYDAVIHILDISQWAFQDHLNEELREDEDNEIFPDLEEGKTLKVRFSEDSIGKNKFPVTSKITFVDRKEAYEESILEDVPNLDELLKSLTYEELEAKFFELDCDLTYPGSAALDGGEWEFSAS